MTHLRSKCSEKFKIASDYRAGAAVPHLVLEFSLACGVAVGFTFVFRDSFHKSTKLKHSRSQIESKDIEAAKWRSESRKYVEGLGSAIDRQMTDWALSTSEKEVAILLLKGLSLK